MSLSPPQHSSFAPVEEEITNSQYFHKYFVIGIKTCLQSNEIKGILLQTRSEKIFLALWLTIKNMLKNIDEMIEKTTALVRKTTDLVTALTELGLALSLATSFITGKVNTDNIYPKLRFIEEIINISTNKQQTDDKNEINVKEQLKQSPDIK